MATSTNRASLLNGLRTGGVRSSSITAPPSTPAPRFPSTANSPVFPDEDDIDLVFPHPFTAPVDGPDNRFSQHHLAPQRPLNPNSVPFSPAYSQHQLSAAEAQLHAYQQLELMQIEIMRLQNAQVQRNQQVQAAILADALRHARRHLASPQPSPVNSSLDMRSSNPSPRRPSQADLLKAQLGVASIPHLEDRVPMSAALGGRFGTRLPSSSIAFPSLPDAGPQSSSPPKQSTIIGPGPARSGSPPHYPPKDNTPSKSEAATSWRRGNTTNSALNGLRAASTASPSVKITPPPGERLSPPLTPASKLRPRPLSFSSMAPSIVHGVAIDSGSEHEDALSSASSTSQSNPATPQSMTSLDGSPLSPREEAAKKLYEGLGIGRPSPYIVQPPVMSLPQRLVSQPLRQPRGPPSGAEELAPKNFATRIRRKAIGGLGVLMDARERRESIEVC